MRVGLDVGGTFTDLVALDASGHGARVKVPSTPSAPERGVLAALESLLAGGVAPASVDLLAHSTTIATNALLGQLGLDLPAVALITTEGFRDVLEIGRQQRSALYDPFVQRPRPLVPRRLRCTVRERLAADGSVLVPLAPASLDAACDQVVASGASVVAVALLHAYADARHERAVGERLAARAPHVEVVLSSEVDAQHREFERTSTTVVHALLRPLVRGYLERLAAGARDLAIDAPLFVMQSNGGMASFEAAARRPATTIESGPAAGAIAAGLLGRRLGIERVLSFDMGGTTAKAATILGGEPQVVGEFEAAGRSHSGRAVKGSGYPVRFPFVDLAEVSAGGGTIAHVDAAGALHVGPLSAGADPGPACYGRSSAPTVTDANLVLGRLNPRALLGGAMPIDAAAARAALAGLAAQLGGLDALDAAAGVVRLVDAEMAKVLRIVTVERGYDPRTFTLIAFGGGGPLHACALADELAICRIVVPRDPGLFSAHGLLEADVRIAFVRSRLERLDAAPPAALEAEFAALEASGRAELASQAVAPAATHARRELELRYAGQSFELTVPAGAPFDDAARRAARAAFDARHREIYGFAAESEPVELVALRVTSIGRIPHVAPPAPPAPAQPLGAAAANEFRTLVTGAGARIATPVYARAGLMAGALLNGPAIVEHYDATTFVDDGWSAVVDESGNIVMERAT